MRRTTAALVALVVAGSTLGGCLGERIGEAPDASAPLPADHDAHHAGGAAAPADPGPADVVLDAHAGMPDAEFALHPDPLNVPLGSIVEIRVENQGKAPHTFTIHRFDADTGQLNPGERRAVKFRADEPGNFEIMCDVPSHYEAGMKATLGVA